MLCHRSNFSKLKQYEKEQKEATNDCNENDLHWTLDSSQSESLETSPSHSQAVGFHSTNCSDYKETETIKLCLQPTATFNVSILSIYL